MSKIVVNSQINYSKVWAKQDTLIINRKQTNLIWNIFLKSAEDLKSNIYPKRNGSIPLYVHRGRIMELMKLIKNE